MNTILKICLITMAFLCVNSEAQDLTELCPICNGRGKQECSLCEGSGKWKTQIDGKKKKIECPACKGTENQPCWLCYGSGKGIMVKEPSVSTNHPEEYSWLWCSSCKHQGVIGCTKCGGNGNIYANDGESSVCGLCEGKRYILCSSCKGSCGWYAKRVKCEVCEGNGIITCSQCNGQGWLPPEHIENTYAEVCKHCKGQGLVPHKECEGKGCKHCKNGNLTCKPCEGHGAIIMTPVPKFKECHRCNHKGVQRCKMCSGRGFLNITSEGISL